MNRSSFPDVVRAAVVAFSFVDYVAYRSASALDDPSNARASLPMWYNGARIPAELAEPDRRSRPPSEKLATSRRSRIAGAPHTSRVIRVGRTMRIGSGPVELAAVG